MGKEKRRKRLRKQKHIFSADIFLLNVKWDFWRNEINTIIKENGTASRY